MTSAWPSTLTVSTLTPDHAQRIAEWRYDGPWAIYDSRPADPPMSGADGYLAVTGPGGTPLVGFCCTGAAARVAGLTNQSAFVDIGVGMDPAHVGAGHGVEFAAAVVAHVRAETPGVKIRAVVQSWNTRSLTVTKRLGFVDAGRHIAVQDGRDVEYTVVTLG
jgi:ribosomal-protein-alanine N-acetyltransferase